MTMEKLAEGLHISVRTLYRRAEKNGVNIASLRDEAGQLTSEGVQALAALFDKDDKTVTRERHDNDTTKTADMAERDARIHELELELATVKAKLDGVEHENELLRQMVESWKEQAEHAQQLHMMQMQLLPEKIGVWQRIRNAFKTDKT